MVVIFNSSVKDILSFVSRVFYLAIKGYFIMAGEENLSMQEKAYFFFSKKAIFKIGTTLFALPS